MYNPKFKEDDVFYMFEFDNGFTYEILKTNVKNMQDIDEWLQHLKTKIWFNEKLERDFISSTAFSVKN